jgi:formyl-CoA transferase
VPWQAGNNHPTSIPTGVFPTADGHMNISVAGGAIWQRFCEVMGHSEWLDDPDFVDAKARSDNRGRMNEVIAECTKAESTATWIGRFNKAGVPCGPIYQINEVFDDPQVQSLALAQPLTSAELGEMRFVRQPVTLTRTPSSFAVAPPEAGEHTDEILDDLGYAQSDIDALRTRGVV